MTQGFTIATSMPVDRQRRAALIVAGLAVAFTVFALPFGNVALPANPAFMPAFGALTFLADLITAVLLLRQAVAAQDRATARLGAAYLFSALAIVPHLLAFPGVFAAAPIIGGSASAVWLWCIWHGGFALVVCWPPSRTGPVQMHALLAGVAIAVLGLTLLVTIGLPYLPTILEGGSFARLNTLGIGPAVAFANAAALVLVVTRLRGRNVLAVWLAVAMLAATLDCLLTLWGSGRFTFGWYLARCLSMATGLVVLIALLSELLSLFDRIVSANRQLEILALTDPLTRIANRRAFDGALATEWRRSNRERTPLAVIALDIDNFKTFNDQYGHPAGDECLFRVADAIGSTSSRAGDITARVGGEEFTVLLPGNDAAAASKIAAVIHAAIAALDIPHAGNPTGRVTVSIGVAANLFPRTGTDAAGLAAAADRALYMAKQTGRNRTCLANQPVLNPAPTLVSFAEISRGTNAA